MSKADNRLILLGTKGGPKIGPDTAWPTSNILVVEGHPYLIDAGLGVTRQVWKAGFNPADIERIFITHHHADHNMELGGFVHNAWISGVVKDVAIFGAPGLNNLMEHYFAGQAFDIASRVGEVGVPPLADLVRWQEFGDGPVYEDARVRVTALRVEHPPVHHCYALRFECAAGVVVFGADTTYFPPLGDFAAGADILLHECMYVPAATKLCEALALSKPTLWDHLSASHTTCEDVGRIATQAGCKHLVLNHYVPDVGQWSTLDDFTQAAGTTFNGKITAGRDLLEIPF